MNRTKQIIFFDGVCNFCNFWVNFILRRDKEDVFRFTALQSEKAKEFTHKINLDISNPDTFILFADGKFYTKSTAALKVCKELKSPIRLLYPFIVLPKFLRDFIYDLVARNRYKIFGKRDTCRLPSSDEREKFLS